MIRARMVTTRLVAGLAFAVLFTGSGVSFADIESPAEIGSAGTDPRIEAATALLGDRDQYPRAIALLREVLQEDPGASQARLWLARVLSWEGRYDEALAQFDRLLDGPTPPATARIEQAEVLSWAGRYDEAEATFDILLAEDPAQTRAWLGLARVYRWSGREAQAEPTYRRALELGAGDEARQEWRDLRSRFPHRLEPQIEYYADTDDFERVASRLGGSYQVGLATRWFGHAGWMRIEGDESLLADRTRDRAKDLEIGIERRFGPRLRALAAIGTRDWSYGPGRAAGRLEFEYTRSETFVLGAAVEHREHLDYSDSFLAVQEGIVGVYPRLQFWKAFGERWESFGRVSFGSLSDHNRRLGVESSFSFRPWAQHDLHADLGARWLRYRSDSPFYYSPEDDLGARLGLSHKLELGRRFGLHWRAGLGFGRTRELGESSSGTELDASAGVTWSWRRWRFEAGFGYARAQRESRYASRHARLAITREF